MALAWGTIVILVLLIPGFLFLFGFYAPERMSREAAPASPLGQLAGVVTVAFVVHAAAYALFAPACHWTSIVPCIDLSYLFSALRLESDPPAAFGAHMASTASMLQCYRWWILGYFLVTGGLGLGSGWGIGTLVVRQFGPFRSLARHAWMYQLIGAKDGHGTIEAFVLTRTSHDGWVLMYRGFLKDFYAAADGTFRQIVLRYPKRYLMHLSGESVAPGRASALALPPWVPLQQESNDPFTKAIPLDDTLDGRNILFVAADEIANVYFQPLAQLTFGAGDRAALSRMIADRAARPSPRG